MWTVENSEVSVNSIKLHQVTHNHSYRSPKDAWILSSRTTNYSLHYVTFHLADAFFPKRLIINAFNHEGTNPRIKKVQSSSRKQNYSALSKCHLSATIFLVWTKVLILFILYSRYSMKRCVFSCVDFLLSWCHWGARSTNSPFLLSG